MGINHCLHIGKFILSALYHIGHIVSNYMKPNHFHWPQRGSHADAGRSLLVLTQQILLEL